MTRKFSFASVLLACITLQIAALSSGVHAYGQSASGNIRGVTQDRSGSPLAQVQITVHSVDENTDRTVVSGGDGAFVVENLKPGHYQLTASKEGFGSSAAATVELVAQQSFRVDMRLALPNGYMGASDPVLPAAPASANRGSTDIGTSNASATVATGSHAQPATENPGNAPLAELVRQLLDRIDQLEQRLAAVEAKDARGATPAATPAQPAPVVSQAKTSATTVAATQPAPVTTASPGAAPAAAPVKRVLLASLEGAFGFKLKSAEKPSPLSVQSTTETASLFTNPALETPNAPNVYSPAAPQGPTPNPAQAQQPGGKAPVPQPAQAIAPPTHILPEALEAPEPTTGVDNFTPFAYGDFTWLNGSPRNKDTVLDTKFFTPEVRFDTHFMEDFNQPRDHTMGGATESFRSGEIQVEQISVGGDFHWKNVRGRILTMDGLFATTTPRNDASAGVGEWDVRGAYKYVSEAYGGYHFDFMHGLNVDAGIFVSYIGLFSYYNFDNWIYQPSFVSSNTPWFFNGLRIQWFPTNKLKIEPWIINGWQSYNKYNGHLGLGGQILYMPREWLKLVFNQYGYGQDNLGVPKVERIHTDDSIEVRYYNHPQNPKGIDKLAFSLTGDLGCQYGPGYRCTGGATKDAFAGWMAYNRAWFGKDKYAISYGGGRMNNPGRYLTLLPPINGADAISGSPYFPENPGMPAHMWDTSLGFQWMPKEYVTWWAEAGYRHSDVPYWTGRGGITPPGGNNGYPAAYVCESGAAAYNSINNTDLTLPQAQVFCSSYGNGGLWSPDLRKSQAVVSLGIMVKF
jgi:hypothetical protein